MKAILAASLCPQWAQPTKSLSLNAGVCDNILVMAFCIWSPGSLAVVSEIFPDDLTCPSGEVASQKA